MRLLIGTQECEVKPHLAAKVGQTDNVDFIFTQNGVSVLCEDLADLGNRITSIIVSETFEEPYAEF